MSTKLNTSGLRRFLRGIWTQFIGIILLIGIIFMSIGSAIFYLYRLIVVHIMAPYFKKDLDQPLTLEGQVMGSELSSTENIGMRCCLVTSLILGGTGTDSLYWENLVNNTVRKNWIEARDPKTGGLLYPEFRQSVYNYMGVLFWKNEANFDLRNHFKVHTINEKASAEESEKFLTGLIESLVSKPFPPDRSPWEFHIVHNYRNGDILRKTEGEEERLTVVILRMHHGMADGFTIMNMLSVKLADSSMSKLNSQLTAAQMMKKKKSSNNFVGNTLEYFKFLGKVIVDSGFFASMCFEPPTPWHIPDHRKKWKLSYARSGMISLERIKRIKNKFGVSFSSVLLSSISYGISRQFELDEVDLKEMTSLPFAIALPLPNHPDGLKNHASGTILKIPLGLGLDSHRRLLETERYVKRAKKSIIPHVLPILQRLVACYPVRVTRSLVWNRILCSGLTNFPGPGVQVVIDGKPNLSCHFCVGGMEGVGGVGFMALSYHDHLWLCSTSDENVLCRKKLERLMGWICEEIETLDRIEVDVSRKMKNF